MNNTVISDGSGFKVMPLGYNVKVSAILGIAGEYRDLLMDFIDKDSDDDIFDLNVKVRELRLRLEITKRIPYPRLDRGGVTIKEVRACEPLGTGLPG